MSMMRASPNGVFIYIALEDDATGNQIIFKIDRPTSATPNTVIAYELGGGSAGNVALTGDLNRMVFHGNLGTNVGIVDHTIVAGTNIDITPAAIGAKVIQPLEVNLDYLGNILAWNEDDADLLQTEDEGATWDTIRTDGGLITSFGGMDVLFKGSFENHNIYVVGDGGSGVKVYESLDEGITLTSLENATLNTAADVVGIFVAGAS